MVARLAGAGAGEEAEQVLVEVAGALEVGQVADAIDEHDLGVVQAGHQLGGDLRGGIGVAVPAVQTSAGAVSDFRAGW